ncbi:hypothetical protein ACFLV7_16105 [Chloroflexota bacterium]
MARKRYSPEQIITKLREAEVLLGESPRKTPLVFSLTLEYWGKQR